MSNEIKDSIRVLAADDHALFRRGIASLVDDELDMKLIAQASTGREAIEQYRQHRPDITLMDLQMPDMSGIEAMIGIRSEFPNAKKIIVLTTYAGDVQVKKCPTSQRNPAPHRNGTLPHFKWNQCPTSTGIRRSLRKAGSASPAR